MSVLLKTVLSTIILLILAFAGLALSILIRKKGRFPTTHIHGNKSLTDKGIQCVQRDDHEEYNKSLKRNKFRNLTYRKE